MAIPNYRRQRKCWWPFTTSTTMSRSSIRASTMFPSPKMRPKAVAYSRWVVIVKIRKLVTILDAVFGTILSQSLHFYVNLRKLLTWRCCGCAVLLVEEFTIYIFSSFFMIFSSSAAWKNRRMINGVLLEYSCTYFSRNHFGVFCQKGFFKSISMRTLFYSEH